MSSAIFSLPELYTSYKNWVSKNPETASELETTAKWISYFIAGRINNSQIISELVYSLSNLLVLFNDRIINQSQRIEKGATHETLKVWLTVLEYSEVFFELSATRLWGSTGKWLLIVCVQLFKCISRLLLIFHYKDSIIEHPPIPVLQRKAIETNRYSDTSINNVTDLDNMSFVLHRSGKVIRKVDSSPPVAFRTWKPLEKSICDNKQSIEQSLIDKQLFAEACYIIKPLIHLTSVACFGNNTWKPWILSLVLDFYSLRLYKKCNKIDNCFTQKQKLQLQRRTVALVLYILRSPFYDKYSRRKLFSLLGCMSDKVPLAHIICNPLMKYIPFWQSTYFYMWST